MSDLGEAMRDPEWLWRYLEDGLVHVDADTMQQNNMNVTAQINQNSTISHSNEYERLQQQVHQQQWTQQPESWESNPNKTAHLAAGTNGASITNTYSQQQFHIQQQQQQEATPVTAPVLTRRDKHRLGERQRRADLRDTVSQLVELFHVTEGSSPVNSLKVVLEAALKMAQKMKSLEKEVEQLRLSQQTSVAVNSSTAVTSLLVKRKNPSSNSLDDGPLTPTSRWVQHPTHESVPTIDPWRIFHSDGVSRILYSRDNIILDANRIFCSDVGYSRAELVGQPMSTITPASKVAMCRLVTAGLRHSPAEGVPPALLNCYLTRKRGMVFRFGGVSAVWAHPCPKQPADCDPPRDGQHPLSSAARPADLPTPDPSQLQFTPGTLGVVPPCTECGAVCIAVMSEGLPTCASDMESYLRINLQTAVRVFRPHIPSTGFDGRSFFIDGSVTYEVPVESTVSTTTTTITTPADVVSPSSTSSDSAAPASSFASIPTNGSEGAHRTPASMAGFRATTTKREILPQGFRSTFKLFYDLASAAASTRTSPPMLEF